MKKGSQTVIMVVVILPVILAFASIAHARDEYEVPAITRIAVEAAEEHTPDEGNWMLISWEGAPRPGPCGGENYGWVLIQPRNNETLKALALSMYFSGKPAHITTSGCRGSFSIVIKLGAPGS